MRIVDLNTLAEHLWCKACNIPLSLKDITSEWKCGLASVFTVKCTSCKMYHKVCTNKKEDESSSYKFDINMKAAFGNIFETTNYSIGPYSYSNIFYFQE